MKVQKFFLIASVLFAFGTVSCKKTTPEEVAQKILTGEQLNSVEFETVCNTCMDASRQLNDSIDKYAENPEAVLKAARELAQEYRNTDLFADYLVHADTAGRNEKERALYEQALKYYDSTRERVVSIFGEPKIKVDPRSGRIMPVAKEAPADSTVEVQQLKTE